MSVDPKALADELLAGRNFGHLGTVNRDGSVQVSPVWVHIEDGRPVFNTAEGRVATGRSRSAAAP